MPQVLTADMKPVIPPKLKKLVLDSLKRHAWNLGVSRFKGDIMWMSEDKIDSDGRTQASMAVDSRYLKCTLNIYPIAIKKWQEQGDDYIEDLVAHEVSHILTDPLYTLVTLPYKNQGEVEDARESLTESIGRMSMQIDKLLSKK